MERRFYDADIITSQAYRKLPPSLKSVYFYIWSKCNKCGVYAVDMDYFKIDTGEKFSETLLEKLEPMGLKKIATGTYFFLNFISVQYGELKENYNPHKPVFRDLQKNNLSFFLEEIRTDEKGNKIFKLGGSLIQASLKLEEEEEYKEEDKEEERKRIVKEKPKSELHTFAESPYLNNLDLIRSTLNEKYLCFDIEYYHDAVMSWSARKPKEKRPDWIDTIRSFMLSDKRDGKPQLCKEAPTVKQQVRISAIEKAMEGLQQYGRRK